jgi:hypothetical protein
MDGTVHRDLVARDMVARAKAKRMRARKERVSIIFIKDPEPEQVFKDSLLLFYEPGVIGPRGAFPEPRV